MLILKSYLDIIFFDKMHLITTAAWFKVYYKSQDVPSTGRYGHIAILQSGNSHKLTLYPQWPGPQNSQLKTKGHGAWVN